MMNLGTLPAEATARQIYFHQNNPLWCLIRLNREIAQHELRLVRDLNDETGVVVAASADRDALVNILNTWMVEYMRASGSDN